jgi:hypothetical protein
MLYIQRPTWRDKFTSRSEVDQASWRLWPCLIFLKLCLQAVVAGAGAVSASLPAVLLTKVLQERLPPAFSLQEKGNKSALVYFSVYAAHLTTSCTELYIYLQLTV